MEEMNYVTEFMDGFKEDIETKWGLFNDPELGDKVKVTILSTGFGLSDVEGLSSRVKKQDQQEAIRDAERAAMEAKRDERRNKYYDDTDNHFVRRAANIFIFNAEDLDNDNIIEAVENTPTMKRSRQQLQDLVKLYAGTLSTAEEQQTKPQQPSGVISFV